MRPKPHHSRWAFYVGLALLAACGVLDPPVATLVIVGHLIHEHTRPDTPLSELGEALEEA